MLLSLRYTIHVCLPDQAIIGLNASFECSASTKDIVDSKALCSLPPFPFAFACVQDLDPKEVEKNELVLNMLRLIKLLVAYDFYCKRTSVTPVITMLIDIIGKKKTLSQLVSCN